MTTTTTKRRKRILYRDNLFIFFIITLLLLMMMPISTQAQQRPQRVRLNRIFLTLEFSTPPSPPLEIVDGETVRDIAESLYETYLEEFDWPSQTTYEYSGLLGVANVYQLTPLQTVVEIYGALVVFSADSTFVPSPEGLQAFLQDALYPVGTTEGLTDALQQAATGTGSAVPLPHHESLVGTILSTVQPAEPTPSPTNQPTTPLPTPLPTTLAPTPIPTTLSPTFNPTTLSPTPVPTLNPTPIPTLTPTRTPTRYPTPVPTLSPTPDPTTLSPTPFPTTLDPTSFPTTLAPTAFPTTLAPTPIPTTLAPSLFPTTLAPTPIPTTLSPTPFPTTLAPTPRPTILAVTPFPTASPTNVMSAPASIENNVVITVSPITDGPSPAPSSFFIPSQSPSAGFSPMPTLDTTTTRTTPDNSMIMTNNNAVISNVIEPDNNNSSTSTTVVAAVCTILATTIVILVIVFFLWRKRKRQQRTNSSPTTCRTLAALEDASLSKSMDDVAPTAAEWVAGADSKDSKSDTGSGSILGRFIAAATAAPAQRTQSPETVPQSITSSSEEDEDDDSASMGRYDLTNDSLLLFARQQEEQDAVELSSNEERSVFRVPSSLLDTVMASPQPTSHHHRSPQSISPHAPSPQSTSPHAPSPPVRQVNPVVNDRISPTFTTPRAITPPPEWMKRIQSLAAVMMPPPSSPPPQQTALQAALQQQQSSFHQASLQPFPPVLTPTTNRITFDQWSDCSTSDHQFLSSDAENGGGSAFHPGDAWDFDDNEESESDVTGMDPFSPTQFGPRNSDRGLLQQFLERSSSYRIAKKKKNNDETKTSFSAPSAIPVVTPSPQQQTNHHHVDIPEMT